MGTRTWLWTAALALALPSSMLAGCGDDTTTGGGGAGGGEGGGGEAPGGAPAQFDTCDDPGLIELAQDATVSVDGTMAGATDDYETFCADSASQTQLSYPEVVYQVTVEAACSAVFTLDGSEGFDGVLGLRTVACTEDEYCANSTANGEEILVPLEAGGDVFLVVSDAGDGTGTFTLTATCASPECGDGFHNHTSGEECDDGNTTAGDGCSPDCLYEPSDPSIDTCAGATASDGALIDTGELLLIPAAAPERTTVGATNSGESSCQTGAADGPAPDHVYKVIPAANGTLIASLGLNFEGDSFCGDTEPVEIPFGCWDRAVHIREATCDDAQAEVACSDDPDQWWRVEVASAEVIAGTEYFVFVDGYNADNYGEGPYVLQLELQ
ncbi:MAG: DUF4215 domain-containing protein [Polyangiaceae bacterium]|jgi:cysteine-rich repeat protein|nr:DUF4215 domain-containing protein [Polyangiaceae bacterium]MBK8937659.1 DUF4215 domain-containing protein [Polyangiaceae bacterium]